MLQGLKIIGVTVLIFFIIDQPINAQIWTAKERFEFNDPIRGIYSDLYEYIQIFYDSTGSLSLSDIRQHESNFHRNSTKEGFQKDGVYWINTTILGNKVKDGRYLFSIGLNTATWPATGFNMSTWPIIDIYIIDEDSLKHLKTGFKRTPDEKEFQNGFSYFWLDLKANEQKNIFARLDPDGGKWNNYSVPKCISLYQYDPTSLNFLDGIYILRNFEKDPPRKNGTPRRAYLFETIQIFPDTTCNMSLQEVIEQWPSNNQYHIDSIIKETCYWTHLNIVNTDSVSRIRIFKFHRKWPHISCHILREDGTFMVKTIGNQADFEFLFLNIPPMDTLSMYCQYTPTVKLSSHILFIEDVYDEDYYSVQKRTLYKYLLLGTLFLPFLFFLIQYTLQRDLLTLYYLIFLLGSTLYLISILDQIPYFEYNASILWSIEFIPIFYSLGSLISLFGLIKFIHLFLGIRSYSLNLLRLGNLLIALFALIVILLLLNFILIQSQGYVFGQLIHVYRIGGAIVFIYALFLSIFGYIKKIKFGTALLIAFSPILLAGVIYAVVFIFLGMGFRFTLFNIDLTLAVGFIFSIVLFGVVIGVRHNSVKAEKIKIQEEMINLQESVNRQLIKVDALKDQFLANTSHELRTPLLGIIGLSESLGEEEKNPRKKQELSMIASSGKRLSSLVNSILDFSKLKTRELKLDIKPIDLRTVVDIVIEISKPLLKGKPVTLHNELNQLIPFVLADEDRMYQIMHNLVGNSIKFTNKGMIRISAIDKESMIQVSVEDSGIGIPEDKINDIFRSFEQIESPDTREHGGTGLGLTITKQLIELQGGTIWIESKLDHGTKVSFTIPKVQGDVTTIASDHVVSRISRPIQNITPEEISQSTDVAEQDAYNMFTILIVDDEPVNQQVLSNHLSHQNFKIYQAMDGQEALKILDQFRPDLVLLDIMMPRMSGFEVCKEIRKKFLPSELPVIMITAKDQVKDLVEGLGAGANDYLSKPFSRDELLARLKTHLNLYNINTAYLRFVPKEFIRSLGHESIIDVKLGDQAYGEMTILFMDIRFFTTHIEKLSPGESFEFLNKYLKCITPAITENGGFIDKYIGDAVMALFPFKSEDAIMAAIAVQQNLSRYNSTREAEGQEPIKIGIGIHTGPIMLGTIGVENRMEGTVISDAVNLASRLEDLNKHYGTTLIISEDTLNGIGNPDKYHYRFLSKVRVKGKKRANKIYEIFDGDLQEEKDIKIETLPLFNKGIKEYYNKKFTQASVLFQQILDIYPEDKTTRILLEHSAEFMVKGVPNEWDGVDILEKMF